MIPITEAELNETRSLEPEVSSVEEIREAIQSAYPFDDGQMVVRHIRSKADVSWYRVNWYRNRNGGLFIDRSRFLALKRTPQGLKVEDQTMPPRPGASFN